jgi:hypothetical protein
MKRHNILYPDTDEDVLEPSVEEVEPLEEDKIPNYVPIPKVAQVEESYPPKKKDRTLGGSLLVYPRKAAVIITKKNYQFLYSKGGVIDFIKSLNTTKPKEIIPLVQEKYQDAAIGCAKNGNKKVNIIWTDPITRFYFDPVSGEEVNFMPEIIRT